MPATDPFTGTWLFNGARSTLSNPAPQSWTQEIVAGRAGLTVREAFTTADGSQITMSVQAAFDGSDYPVEGSAAIETMAYQRPSPDTIHATGKKGGVVVLTETVTMDASFATFTQRYQVYLGGNVVATGIAVFEKG